MAHSGHISNTVTAHATCHVTTDLSPGSGGEWSHFLMSDPDLSVPACNVNSPFSQPLVKS